jgi:branched-chain amino acid aminotransferase
MAFVLHRFVLHNDQVQEASALSLSPGQVGLLSGWGVFSTLRVADGVLFAWERHWARIQRDAKALHVPLPEDPERVHNHLLELVGASDVIALTADSKDWGDGVKLAYQRDGRHAAGQFAGAKILSWAMNLTWLESAQARGFDEVILLNERGEVAECTSANIFIAEGNQVWTPPLGSGCLPGITREVLLGEVRVQGIRIGEKTLVPSDLELADEVFITSTTRDLLPVVQIEEKRVGRSERARQVLTGAFGEFVRKYVAGHKAAPAVR